jgi:hypothetical protein
VGSRVGEKLTKCQWRLRGKMVFMYSISLPSGVYCLHCWDLSSLNPTWKSVGKEAPEVSFLEAILPQYRAEKAENGLKRQMEVQYSQSGV